MTVKGFRFELTFGWYDPEVLRELIDAGRRSSTSDVERGEVAR